MRWLLIFFVMLLLASGLPGWMRKIGLGRLPGDLRISVFGREVRLPLASALVLSLLTTWAQELGKVARHAEHPWNQNLKIETLLLQARAIMRPRPARAALR